MQPIQKSATLSALNQLDLPVLRHQQSVPDSTIYDNGSTIYDNGNLHDDSRNSDKLTDVFGELVGRSGTWQLSLGSHFFNFHRAATKQKPTAADVNVAFDDVTGVEFIRDGGPLNHFLCIYSYPRCHGDQNSSSAFSRRFRRSNSYSLENNNNNNNSNSNSSSNSSSNNSSSTNPKRHRTIHILRLCCNCDRETLLRINRAATLALQPKLQQQQLQLEKPLLILINPKSGSGRSRRIFNSRVLPLLREAGLRYRVMHTEARNHARQLLAGDHSITAYAAIVLVSGDGLLFEAVNGLASRPDWREVMNRLPLAVLPTGSGNGMASSLASDSGDSPTEGLLLNSAFNLVKRNVGRVDLMCVQFASSAQINEPVISSLSITYGLIADIDIESERARWMGSARHTAISVLKLVGPKIRTVRARISYLPATDGAPANAVADDDDAGSSGSIRSQCRYLPQTVEQPVGSEWITVEDDFVTVIITVQSHLSSDCHFTPACKPSDSNLYITSLNAAASRKDLVQILLQMEHGQHVQSPHFNCWPARAFRLQPITAGRVCIDGELMPCTEMQGEVLPQMLQMVTDVGAAAVTAVATDNGNGSSSS